MWWKAALLTLGLSALSVFGLAYLIVTRCTDLGCN